MVQDHDEARRRMLATLRWEETSGVDHPANEEEGWAVMKSADGAEALGEEMRKLLEEEVGLAKAHQELLEELEVAVGAEGYLADAPDTVKAATTVLLDFLRTFQNEDAGAASPEVGAAKAKHPAKDGMHPKSAVLQLASKVLDLLTQKNRSNGTVTLESFAKALETEWPEFLTKVTAIVQNDDGHDAKTEQIAETVSLLKDRVAAGVVHQDSVGFGELTLKLDPDEHDTRSEANVNGMRSQKFE